MSSRLKLSGKVPPAWMRTSPVLASPFDEPPPVLRCQLATGSKRKKPSEEIKEATTRGGEKPETELQPRTVAPDAAHFYFRPRRYYSYTGGGGPCLISTAGFMG